MRQPVSACYDCGLAYTAPGFQDLLIPNWAWRRISPSVFSSDGGLLCPSCICSRLEIAGIKCYGAFFSGPIMSVSEIEMSNHLGFERMQEYIEKAGK